MLTNAPRSNEHYHHMLGLAPDVRGLYFVRWFMWVTAADNRSRPTVHSGYGRRFSVYPRPDKAIASNRRNDTIQLVNCDWLLKKHDTGRMAFVVADDEQVATYWQAGSNTNPVPFVVASAYEPRPPGVANAIMGVQHFGPHTLYHLTINWIT